VRQIYPQNWPLNGRSSDPDVLYFELGDIQGLALDHFGTWVNLWGRFGCRARSGNWNAMFDSEYGITSDHEPVVAHHDGPIDSLIAISKNDDVPDYNAADVDLWRGVSFGCCSANEQMGILNLTNVQIVAAFWKLHQKRDSSFHFANDFVGPEYNDGDTVKPDIIIGLGFTGNAYWQYENYPYPEETLFPFTEYYMFDGSACGPLVADSKSSESADKFATSDNRSRISAALSQSHDAKMVNLIGIDLLGTHRYLFCTLPCPYTQGDPPISAFKYVSVEQTISDSIPSGTFRPNFVTIDAVNYDWGEWGKN